MDRVKYWMGTLAAIAATFGSGAISSTARADMLVCNQYHTDIWFAYTVDDSSCGSSPWRQRSWWRAISQGACVQIFSHSAANHTYWTYAEAVDGSRRWPSTGTLNWHEIYNDSFGQEPGTCWDNADLRCSNPGVTCINRPHAQNVIGNSTRFTVTYTNN